MSIFPGIVLSKLVHLAQSNAFYEAKIEFEAGGDRVQTSPKNAADDEFNTSLSELTAAFWRLKVTSQVVSLD